MNAKLARWTEVLQPFMERDSELGLYPELGMMKLVSFGQGFEEFAAAFKSKIVPEHAADFKEAVECSEWHNTAADLWGEVINAPAVGAMLDVSDEAFPGIDTLPDHPHWEPPTASGNGNGNDAGGEETTTRKPAAASTATKGAAVEYARVVTAVGIASAFAAALV